MHAAVPRQFAFLFDAWSSVGAQWEREEIRFKNSNSRMRNTCFASMSISLYLYAHQGWKPDTYSLCWQAPAPYVAKRAVPILNVSVNVSTEPRKRRPVSTCCCSTTGRKIILTSALLHSHKFHFAHLEIQIVCTLIRQRHNSTCTVSFAYLCLMFGTPEISASPGRRVRTQQMIYIMSRGWPALDRVYDLTRCELF